MYEAEILRVSGVLHENRGAVDLAEAAYASSIEVARRQQAKTFELRSATSLARLWQKLEKREGAGRLLEPVFQWFTEGRGTRDLVAAEGLLADLS